MAIHDYLIEELEAESQRLADIAWDLLIHRITCAVAKHADGLTLEERAALVPSGPTPAHFVERARRDLVNAIIGRASLHLSETSLAYVAGALCSAMEVEDLTVRDGATRPEEAKP